jgi:chromosome segregation ATPase
MTGWDVVSIIINQFSPFAMTLLFITIVIIGIVGFSKHGMGFIRHGFNQNFLNEILSKLATKEEIAKLATKEELAKLATREELAKLATREELAKLATKEDINSLEARLETRIDKMESRLEKVETRMENMETEMGGMKTELATIKVNHFGHLKDFLSELTSILQDKGIFNNTERTRLENKLRGI